MKKYEINYYFDGSGTDIVEAESLEEAEEKWRNGEIEIVGEEQGQEYNINSVIDHKTGKQIY